MPLNALNLWRMHEYDTTLKSLLTRPDCAILRILTGSAICRWHNVELPEVRNLRVDLLGETANGDLVHIELQRDNNSGMVLRMAEYAFSIHRQFGKWPHQFVLYIGQAPLRMLARVESHALTFECGIADIRQFDAEPLLASPHLEDNIVAILARLHNERDSVRRILENIAEHNSTRRSLALSELTILAGLRKLGSVLGQEARNMPILDDIMDHDLLGPAIRQGREEGLHQGELRLLRFQIQERFGTIPEWASQRLETFTSSELEQMALKLFNAETIEDLFA